MSRFFVAFDIETVPNPATFDRLPEPEVKVGNVKDPKKIQAKLDEAKSEQVSKCALNPLYSRICCAVLAADQGTFDLVINDMTDDEEVRVIREILTIIARDDVWPVTWNGSGFDFPFLYKRCMLLNIDMREFNLPPLTHWVKRYQVETHIDLMQVWGGWSQNFSKLDEVAGIVAQDNKIKIDFADFPELLKTAEGRQKIVDYCKQDTILTLKIANKMKGFMF